MYTLEIGMNVRILMPLNEVVPTTGTIYNYLPSRPWPWHVRPEGWPIDVSGIAFTADEIEPLVDAGQLALID